MTKRALASSVALFVVGPICALQSPVLVMGCETTNLLEEACPSKNQHLGADIATGDFNGDDITDIALGGFTHPTPGGDGLTRAVLFLGKENPAGRVYYDTPNLVIEGNGFSDQFAFSLAFVPDMNSDGRDELVVGAPNWPNVDPMGGTNYVSHGKVDFFFGAALANTTTSCPPSTGPIIWNAETCADFTWTGSLEGQRFGASVAGVARFDGDLVPDFAIGAPGSVDVTVPYAGEVHVITGPSYFGLVHPTPPAECDQIAYPGPVAADFGEIVIEAPSPSLDGDRFGFSLAFVGDFYGTRPSELLIGAPQFLPTINFNHQVVNGSSIGSGYAQVYTYDPSDPLEVDGVVAVLDERLPGSGVGQYDSVNGLGEGYGFSVDGQVDIDDDNKVDLYVGAPFFEDATLGLTTGRVLSYSGATLATLHASGSGSPDTGRIFERIGEIPCAQFGSSVGPLGDLDDDGEGDEILVGAWLARRCDDSVDPCSNSACTDFVCPTTNPTGDDDNQGGIQTGAAYVVGAGSAGVGELLIRIIGEDPRDHMGFAVLGTALDASGAVDVIASGLAWAATGGLSETGRVYIFGGEFLRAQLP